MGDWRDKRDEYQALKSRRKARQALKACGICGEPSTFNCVCGTIAYCSQACKTVDWRDRGHREACERIRDADAAAPSPPPEAVVYGPAPRSDADEARARIAAEHEAARARREANPSPEPLSPRYGSRCPICREAWDVNVGSSFRVCCAMNVCVACAHRICDGPCPLCRAPPLAPEAFLAALRRRAGEGSAAALYQLGQVHRAGALGLARDAPRAVELYGRASDLGDVEATVALAYALHVGDGVARDDERALELCRAAADRGHAKAQCDYGTTLYERREFEAAFAYYVHSADQGFTLAEFYVGRYLQLGLAAGRDLEAAKRWYERAAAKGHGAARHSLRDLAEGRREVTRTELEVSAALAAEAFDRALASTRAELEAELAATADDAEAARAANAALAEEARAARAAFAERAEDAEAARAANAALVDDAGAARAANAALAADLAASEAARAALAERAEDAEAARAVAAALSAELFAAEAARAAAEAARAALTQDHACDLEVLESAHATELATAARAAADAARAALANAHAGDIEELWDLHAQDLEELEDSHATDLADAVRATRELKDSHAREIADAVEVRHASTRVADLDRELARARDDHARLLQVSDYEQLLRRRVTLLYWAVCLVARVAESAGLIATGAGGAAGKIWTALVVVASTACFFASPAFQAACLRNSPYVVALFRAGNHVVRALHLAQLSDDERAREILRVRDTCAAPLHYVLVAFQGICHSFIGGGHVLFQYVFAIALVLLHVAVIRSAGQDVGDFIAPIFAWVLTVLLADGCFFGFVRPLWLTAQRAADRKFELRVEELTSEKESVVAAGRGPVAPRATRELESRARELADALETAGTDAPGDDARVADLGREPTRSRDDDERPLRPPDFERPLRSRAALLLWAVVVFVRVAESAKFIFTGIGGVLGLVWTAFLVVASTAALTASPAVQAACLRNAHYLAAGYTVGRHGVRALHLAQLSAAERAREVLRASETYEHPLNVAIVAVQGICHALITVGHLRFKGLYVLVNVGLYVSVIRFSGADVGEFLAPLFAWIVTMLLADVVVFGVVRPAWAQAQRAAFRHFELRRQLELRVDHLSRDKARVAAERPVAPRRVAAERLVAPRATRPARASPAREVADAVETPTAGAAAPRDDVREADLDREPARSRDEPLEQLLRRRAALLLWAVMVFARIAEVAGLIATGTGGVAGRIFTAFVVLASTAVVFASPAFQASCLRHAHYLAAGEMVTHHAVRASHLAQLSAAERAHEVLRASKLSTSPLTVALMVIYGICLSFVTDGKFTFKWLFTLGHLGMVIATIAGAGANVDDFLVPLFTGILALLLSDVLFFAFIRPVCVRVRRAADAANSQLELRRQHELRVENARIAEYWPVAPRATWRPRDPREIADAFKATAAGTDAARHDTRAADLDRELARARDDHKQLLRVSDYEQLLRRRVALVCWAVCLVARVAESAGLIATGAGGAAGQIWTALVVVASTACFFASPASQAACLRSAHYLVACFTFGNHALRALRLTQLSDDERAHELSRARASACHPLYYVLVAFQGICHSFITGGQFKLFQYGFAVVNVGLSLAVIRGAGADASDFLTPLVGWVLTVLLADGCFFVLVRPLWLESQRAADRQLEIRVDRVRRARARIAAERRQDAPRELKDSPARELETPAAETDAPRDREPTSSRRDEKQPLRLPEFEQLLRGRVALVYWAVCVFARVAESAGFVATGVGGAAGHIWTAVVVVASTACFFASPALQAACLRKLPYIAACYRAGNNLLRALHLAPLSDVERTREILRVRDTCAAPLHYVLVILYGVCHSFMLGDNLKFKYAFALLNVGPQLAMLHAFGADLGDFMGPISVWAASMLVADGTVFGIMRPLWLQAQRAARVDDLKARVVAARARET